MAYGYRRRFRRGRRSRFRRRFSRYSLRGRYVSYKPVNSSNRSRLTVKFPLYVNASVIQTANGTYGSHVFFNLMGDTSNDASLLNATGFRQYCAMYEEFKIDSVRVTVSGLQGVIGQGQVTGMVLVTAWHRHLGCAELPWPQSPGSAQYLMNSSSSRVKTFVNNNVVKVTRACYASDVQERTQFCGTTVGTKPTGVDYIVGYEQVADPKLFNPSLGIGISIRPAPTLNYAYNFMLCFSVTVTFRSPHYGVLDAPQNRVLVAPAPADDDDDDGGEDADDGDDDDSPPKNVDGPASSEPEVMTKSTIATTKPSSRDRAGKSIMKGTQSTSKKLSKQ